MDLLSVRVSNRIIHPIRIENFHEYNWLIWWFLGVPINLQSVVPDELIDIFSDKLWITVLDYQWSVSLSNWRQRDISEMSTDVRTPINAKYGHY